MKCAMTLSAKPSHLQRLIVVFVMHLGVGIAALLARLGFDQAAIQIHIGKRSRPDLVLLIIGQISVAWSRRTHIGCMTVAAVRLRLQSIDAFAHAPMLSPALRTVPVVECFDQSERT